MTCLPSIDTPEVCYLMRTPAVTTQPQEAFALLRAAEALEVSMREKAALQLAHTRKRAAQYLRFRKARLQGERAAALALQESTYLHKNVNTLAELAYRIAQTLVHEAFTIDKSLLEDRVQKFVERFFPQNEGSIVREDLIDSEGLPVARLSVEKQSVEWHLSHEFRQVAHRLLRELRSASASSAPSDMPRAQSQARNVWDTSEKEE